MQKKHWSTLFKILSSLLILYLLYKSIDFSSEEFLATWKQIDFVWLLLTLPVVLIVLSIKSFRWRSIIVAGGHTYDWKNSIKAYLAAYSIGVVTPGRLGELFKVYNLRRDVSDFGAVPAFQTVVLDRLFDMFFLGWFGLSGLLYFLKPLGDVSGVNALLLSFAIAVFILIFGKFILVWISEQFFKENKIIHFILECLMGMSNRTSIFPWLYSAIAYAIYFAGIQFLMFSLGISIHYIETGFIISLIGLILLLPISIAGFGTREVGLVYLLSIYSISAETAVSFSLLQFLTFFIWGGFIGLLFYLMNAIPLNIIKVDINKYY